MRAAPVLAACLAGVLSCLPAFASEPTPPETPAAAQKEGTTGNGEPVAVEAASAAPATPPAPAAAAKMVLPKRPRPAAPTLGVRIDLSAQRLTLHYDGRQQESWPISSGRQGYPTPRGVFRPQWASRMWYSRKYDNAPMPHAVFFTGGIAVHGTTAIGMLGRPASHGCIRLAPGNAARFYALVHKHGVQRTRIEVLGEPPAPRIAARQGPRLAEASRSRAPGRLPLRAAGQASTWGWGGGAAPRRGADGLVYLPPASPLQGRTSFVHNGVVYVRVR